MLDSGVQIVFESYLSSNQHLALNTAHSRCSISTKWINKNITLPILSDSPHPGSLPGFAPLSHLLGSGWSHRLPRHGLGPSPPSPGWLSSFVPLRPCAQEARSFLGQAQRPAQGLASDLGPSCLRRHLERENGDGRTGFMVQEGHYLNSSTKGPTVHSQVLFKIKTLPSCPALGRSFRL